MGWWAGGEKGNEKFSEVREKELRRAQEELEENPLRKEKEGPKEKWKKLNKMLWDRSCVVGECVFQICRGEEPRTLGCP